MTDSIESDRVELFNAWAAFRSRIGKLRSKGHRVSVRQSLLPMLTEMLEEVNEGFRSPDHFEQPELRAEVRFGRVSVRVSKGAEEEYELVGAGREPVR